MSMGSFAHGLMFHHFCNDRHPRVQGAIGADELDALLSYVGIARILSADEWTERALAGRLRESDLCITLDDALRCQYDVALPVFESHGLTAFWFVYSAVFEGHRAPLEIYRWFRTTQFSDVDAFYAAFDAAVSESALGTRVAAGLGGFDPASYLAGYDYFSTSDRRFRYIRDELLSTAEYEELMDTMIAARDIDLRAVGSSLWMDDSCLVDLDRKGHVVGLHSYSHPTTLARLLPAVQKEEYRRNATHLERVLGKRPTSVSHPSNSYDRNTLAILADLGVEIGFRADMDGAAPTQLELPRADHANVLAAMKRA